MGTHIEQQRITYSITDIKKIEVLKFIHHVSNLPHNVNI